MTDMPVWGLWNLATPKLVVLSLIVRSFEVALTVTTCSCSDKFVYRKAIDLTRSLARHHLLEVHIKRQPKMDIIIRLYAQLIDAVVDPNNVGTYGKMLIKTIFHGCHQIGRFRSGIKRNVGNVIAFHVRLEKTV